MPPIVFIAAAAATFANPTMSAPIPSGSRPGDTVLVIVGMQAAGTLLPATTSDGELLQTIAAGVGQIRIFRRVLTGTEGSTLSFTATGAPTKLTGVSLLYRGLSAGSVMGASGVTAFAAATSFIAPSIATAAYSDIVVNAVYVDSPSAIVVTPPAGMTERYDGFGALSNLEVSDVLLETVSFTGTKTSTGVSSSGITALFALYAGGVAGADKAITGYAVPGAIGLPTKGI